jgi:hypothetical protein
MGSEWILWRGHGVAQLPQNKDQWQAGSYEYDDEPSGSGATELVKKDSVKCTFFTNLTITD